MIADTAAELREIARAARDASGYFPALYARVTAEVAAAVEQRGFEDGRRMDELATTFARYYTRALRRESPRPRCWEASWKVVGDQDLLVVQHLLLGINAHVNHDLPQAVVDVADRGGDLAAMRGDFDAINAILASSYSQVMDDLDRATRWADEAATLGGTTAFNFSLHAARRQAWSAAERLHPLGREGRRAYLAELDRLVSALAYLVTRPAFPMSLLARLARRLENRDPRAVTAALLGER